MKILTNILYGFFALLTLGVLAMFIFPSVPFAGHIEVKIVKSGSMEPTINTGGIVAIRESETYGLGDVITFTSQGADIPTTHRIIAMEDIDGVTMITTKGDANEDADSALITQDAIIGKVLFDMPYAGFVLDFARQPMGFMLLIALPALLIVVDEIEKIWKEMQRLRVKRREEKHEADALIVAPFVARPTKKRMMDINQKVSFVETRVAKGVRSVPIIAKQKPEMRQSASSYAWVLAPSIVLVFSSLMVSVWTFGGTISYFSDIESALANEINASALGFTAVPDDTSFSFVDGVLDDPDGAVITTVTPEVQSVNLMYSLNTEVVEGNSALCDSITVTATDPFVYAGPLSTLSGTNILFSGPWTLDMTLLEGPYVEGDTCVVDMVYTGWNTLTNGNGGYEDEEKVTLSFVVSPSQLTPIIDTGAFRGASLIEEVIVEPDPNAPIETPTEPEVIVEDPTPIEEVPVVEEVVETPLEPEPVVEEVTVPEPTPEPEPAPVE